ncbi:MAG TPA: FG-GAP-like repeat-containing protein [Patescibacteria group bacterium]|nr:FG-GAP-like repeat-containing protein [Patescibacteria group bacterium]
MRRAALVCLIAALAGSGVVAILRRAAAAGPASGAAPAASVGAAAHAGTAADAGAADDPIRANNRGAALMEQYKSAQAIEEFSKVTAFAPRWAPGFVNLGLAAFYSRQTERAAAAFQESIRLDPGSLQGHYGLALLYKNEGKSAEAIAELERAGALDPQDADILYHLGVLQSRQRQFKEAIETLKRARQIDPNGMSIRYQLARALLQSGDNARGEAEMSAYQKLAANPRFAQPTGNQYGEAGRYALVITDVSGLVAQVAPPASGGSAPPVTVRFTDASATAGIAFRHGGPGGEAGAAPVSAGASVARFGSGLGVGDLDGDGLPDLVFANASADGTARPAVYRNLGNLTFKDVTAASGVVYRGRGLGVALADYDNDGDLDLYLTGDKGGVLFQNQGAGVFKDVGAAAQAAVGGLAAGAAWGDLDHDGDLDLLVTRLPSASGGTARAAVLLNLGDGKFKESAASLHLAGPATGAVGALFTDFDLDRDIDIVLSSPGGQDALLDNRRDLGFADVGKEAGLAARGAGRGVAAGDVDGDGRTDLVFASGPGGGSALYLNGAGRTFTRRDLPQPPGGAACGAVLFDADNDGDLDLFLTGSGGLLLLNDGRGSFTDAGAESGLASIAIKDGRGAAAADLDGDGDLDLVISTNGGRPILLRNDGGNRNRWLDVAPKGLNSNRMGVGSKVEMQSGPDWARREVYAGSGFLSSGPATVHFGLGAHGIADVVRVLWPGGVLQAEMDVPSGERLEPQELDRKGSSCPLLFAWNGVKYGFITDFLGVGGLGLWTAPGAYGQPVPDESIRIGPDQLIPSDGAYLLQVVENLEEVTYLDAASLLAVDHPKEIDVFPNEDFGGPPTGGAKIYAVEKASRLFPVQATDDRNRNMLDRVLAIDRIYPDEFRLLSQAGYAEMHYLTLDFPDAAQGQEGLVLFLYGWTDFEYSSSNYAAYQSGMTQTIPVLEMEDADGLYKPVVPAIGFPPGLPRMMTVDLASLGPLPSRHLRLRTNMRIFWDQAFLARPLDDAAFDAKVKVSEAKLAAAHLHRHGFPREHSPDGREPRLYDYGIIDRTQPFRVMTGDYTRYGRVTELLADADDRAVIFGKGEEVTLEFAVKGLPATPKGSVRSFVLRTSGWCKDMDPHTAHGETVEPLPFRSMTAYPYAEGETYPDDPAHARYRKEWNTRHLEGR